MQAVISPPGNIKGIINIPPSKSMMQRACAAALLHKGYTVIHNPGTSDDDKAALGIIIKLGATIVHMDEHSIMIESEGINPRTDTLHCGESGLAARLFIPIAALSTQNLRIEGNGALLVRPMGVLQDVLPKLNVAVQHNNGALPYQVQGPLKPKDITIDGSLSSQFLTGLLFAYTYNIDTPATITADNLKSTPYIAMTLQMLEQFGKPVQQQGNGYYIDPAKFTHKDEVEVTIEGDWSSAALWLTAGTLSGDVTVGGLNMQSAQADRAIMDVLAMAGAAITVTHEGIHVGATGALKAFTFDATNCPDLFPITAVLAACCNGESTINGVTRLFNKESNRAESISNMLDQFGVAHAIEGDELHITGRKELKANIIDGYNDHRIVMAATVAALKTKGQVTITDADSVSKSYPDFFDHLYGMGANCILNDL